MVNIVMSRNREYEMWLTNYFCYRIGFNNLTFIKLPKKTCSRIQLTLTKGIKDHENAPFKVVVVECTKATITK